MVDRNRNGIPDEDEKRGPAYGRSPQLAPKVSAAPRPQRPSSTPSQMGNPFQGVQDVVKGIGTALGVAASPIARFGIHGDARQSQAASGNRMGGIKPRSGSIPGDAQKSFADYLAEAMSMIGGGGGAGGGGGVNYDPQRNTARGQASEADSRLEAMYRQLRGSIDADAPVIQGNYQTAIDNTANTVQTTQDQIQGATNSANAQNNEVLAALGIQQAQGNIIQNGTDLNSQTARNIADSAAQGQASGERLASNQGSALAHNTNIGNAAGLEGNLQRAANQARLQSLLAEIDMKEQQDNASLAAQSSGGGVDFGQQLSLAQELMGFDRYNQEYGDELQMNAMELANNQKTALPNFDQMIQALAARGIAVPEDPRQLASLLDSARRYSF